MKNKETFLAKMRRHSKENKERKELKNLLTEFNKKTELKATAIDKAELLILGLASTEDEDVFLYKSRVFELTTEGLFMLNSVDRKLWVRVTHLSEVMLVMRYLTLNSK